MRRRSFLTLVTTTLGVGVIASGKAAAADRTFLARLRGANEIPARDTPAGGIATLMLSADGTALEHRLVVHTIDNVVAAHIHLGGPEVNGPVVAFLYGPAAPGTGRMNGVLATGTITAADLTGPLSGQPLTALLEAMTTGNAYVNVHTNDGDPATSGIPGDFPAGEIRGQIL